MDATTSPGLSRAAVAVLALAGGGAIANANAIQPALATVAATLHATSEAVSLVPTGAMIGYLLGLVLLVPLVDRLRPDLLIPGQLVSLAVALGLADAAPTTAALVACYVAVGALTTVAAECTALVGQRLAPEVRGAGMGVVAAGLSAGLLLSRLIGGALTGWLGWRPMLLCFAAFCLATAASTRRVLPRQAPPASGEGYLLTLRSVPRLLTLHRALRRSCAAGMLWFLAFNLIWVGISLRLAEPPYSLTASTIGLYGLAGTLGLLVTRVAGRLADRYGTRPTMIAGLTLAATGAGSLIGALGHPVWTGVSLATFDAGCFAAQVANQVSIVSLDHSRSGALSSTYLLLYYTSGAIGTVGAGLGLGTFGWHTLALLATLAVIAAALTASTGGDHVTPVSPRRNESQHRRT